MYHRYKATMYIFVLAMLIFVACNDKKKEDEIVSRPKIESIISTPEMAIEKGGNLKVDLPYINPSIYARYKDPRIIVDAGEYLTPLDSPHEVNQGTGEIIYKLDTDEEAFLETESGGLLSITFEVASNIPANVYELELGVQIVGTNEKTGGREPQGDSKVFSIKGHPSPTPTSTPIPSPTPIISPTPTPTPIPVPEIEIGLCQEDLEKLMNGGKIAKIPELDVETDTVEIIVSLKETGCP